MSVRAQKSGRHPRKRAVVGDGVIAQLERDKDVRQLVAAEAKERTADHQARIALTAYFIAEKRGFEPGHELDDWLAAILLSLAAVTRVFAPALAPDAYQWGVMVAGALWICAFAIFIVVYAPILVRPRIDGRQG